MYLYLYHAFIFYEHFFFETGSRVPQAGLKLDGCIIKDDLDLLLRLTLAPKYWNHKYGPHLVDALPREKPEALCMPGKPSPEFIHSCYCIFILCIH